MQPAAQLLLQQLIKCATAQCLKEGQCSSRSTSIAKQLSSLLAEIPNNWLVSDSSLSALSMPLQTLSPGVMLDDQQMHSVLQKAHMLLLVLAEAYGPHHAQSQLALVNVEKRLLELQQQLDAQDVAQGVAFTWVDSLLVTAMRQGCWVSTPPSLLAHHEMVVVAAASVSDY